MGSKQRPYCNDDASQNTKANKPAAGDEALAAESALHGLKSGIRHAARTAEL